MTEPLDIDDWSLYPLEDGTALLLKRLGKAETLDYQANYFMKVAELEKQKWR